MNSERRSSCYLSEETGVFTALIKLLQQAVSQTHHPEHCSDV